jgi:hypothetical protein
MDSVPGDLQEEFALRVAESSSFRAKLWYSKQVAISLPNLLWLKWKRERMGRHIAAVAAGYFVMAVGVVLTDLLAHPLHARSPFAFSLLTAVVGATMMVAGGHLAVRISGRLKSAVTLGLFSFAMGILSALETWPLVPVWYSVTLLLVPIPAAWLGGWLRVSRAR